MGERRVRQADRVIKQAGQFLDTRAMTKPFALTTYLIRLLGAPDPRVPAVKPPVHCSVLSCLWPVRSFRVAGADSTRSRRLPFVFVWVVAAAAVYVVMSKSVKRRSAGRRCTRLQVYIFYFLRGDGPARGGRGGRKARSNAQPLITKSVTGSIPPPKRHS